MSLYDNSSNKDIESDLSGGNDQGECFGDLINKINNDNLSEVSEESAFEEEDDEDCAGFPTTTQG
jgi:hypothetical protein